jgi:hypothetical protein
MQTVTQLSVASKSFMLSVIMLKFVMLSVVAPPLARVRVK